MPESVDARMDDVEPPGAKRVLDPLSREPTREELPSRDPAELALREGNHTTDCGLVPLQGLQNATSGPSGDRDTLRDTDLNRNVPITERRCRNLRFGRVFGALRGRTTRVHR